MIRNLLLLTLPLCAMAQTPNVQWTQSLGGSSSDIATDMIQTTDGGFLLIGDAWSNNGQVFGAHGENDMWMAKLNPSGSIVWKRSLGGSNADYGRRVIQTADNNYVVSGCTHSMNGDIAQNHGGALGSSDYWLAKINSSGSSGNIIWQKSYGGTQHDWVNSHIMTPDGGFLLVGTSYSNDGQVTQNNGFNDVWLVKTDAVGEIIWQKVLGGSGQDYGNTAMATADGGYIVVGRTNSNDNIFTHEDVSAYKAFAVKLDEDGNTVWAKLYGGTQESNLAGIFQLPDGYLLSGGTQSDGIPGHQTAGGYDGWILKTDLNGETIESYLFGGSSDDRMGRILQTQNGDYVVGGSTSSNNGDVSGNHGLLDGWLVKLGSDFEIVWQKCIGGSGSDAAGLAFFTPDGGYALCGNSDSSNNGDVGSNHGQEDYYVVKLLPEALSSSEFEKGTVRVYPNPTSDELHLELPQGIEPESIAVSDISGKEIHKTTNASTVDVSQLPTGSYVVTVKTSDKTFSTKFIKK